MVATQPKTSCAIEGGIFYYQFLIDVLGAVMPKRRGRARAKEMNILSVTPTPGAEKIYRPSEINSIQIIPAGVPIPQRERISAVA